MGVVGREHARHGIEPVFKVLERPPRRERRRFNEGAGRIAQQAREVRRGVVPQSCLELRERP